MLYTVNVEGTVFQFTHLELAYFAGLGEGAAGSDPDPPYATSPLKEVMRAVQAYSRLPPAERLAPQFLDVFTHNAWARDGDLWAWLHGAATGFKAKEGLFEARLPHLLANRMSRL